MVGSRHHIRDPTANYGPTVNEFDVPSTVAELFDMMRNSYAPDETDPRVKEQDPLSAPAVGIRVQLIQFQSTGAAWAFPAG